MVPLVSIGDSLTQGFQNGCIFKCHLSYPALLADLMGVLPQEFLFPDFTPEGGFPVNMEMLLNELAVKYGRSVSGFEWAPALGLIQRAMDRVEDYWERGRGARPSATGPLHHNLAVWGFEVADADTLTDAICKKYIAKPKDNLFKQVPEWAKYRTTRRTFNPGAYDVLARLTQIELAKRISKDQGKIENLIFWLGANNCLGTVLDLEIRESTPSDLMHLAHKRSANLWRPHHFRQIYRRVADQIDEVGAQHVFVGNVPHVTIPPVTRGVSVRNKEQNKAGYFEYYTRFWIWDEDFKKDPGKYKSLKRHEARYIDDTIDEYNKIIAKEAAERGWHLIDMCQLLDQLAFRRQSGTPRFQFPAGLVRALGQSNNLDYLVQGGDRQSVALDTRYLTVDNTDPSRLSKGGVFSLDGFHLTTIGYAVVADQFRQAINNLGDRQIPEDASWWKRVIATDSLINRPPKNLASLRETLTLLSSRGLLQDMLSQLSGGAFR